MQKIVLKVGFHDDKIKQKAMKAVSGIQGVESVSVDMKESKMTVVGSIDAITVVGKLRKVTHTDILSVGPAKEEEKKKEEPKKQEEKKAEEAVPWICYPNYHPYPYYYVAPVEQDGVGCVIC